LALIPIPQVSKAIYVSPVQPKEKRNVPSSRKRHDYHLPSPLKNGETRFPLTAIDDATVHVFYGISQNDRRELSRRYKSLPV